MHDTIPQIYAADACAKSSEWTRPFELYSGHKTIAEATSYKMTEFRCPNRNAFIQRAVEDIKIYEVHDFAHRVPAIKLYAFENAIILPEGVIIVDKLAVAETITPLPHNSRKKLLESLEKLQGEAEALSCFEAGCPVMIIEQPGINNYGHWLIEMFPKIVPLLKHIVAKQARIAISKPASSAMERLIWETFEQAGVPEDAIQWLSDKPTRFSKVIYMSQISKHQHNPGHISPWCVTMLNHNTASIVGGERRKLFLSRKDTTKRQLLNEDAVFAALEPFGYEKICTGQMSFTEQVEAFKGATHIIGVFGAGLTNVVFCQPGTRLLNICPNNFLDHFYWNIASLRQVSYWHFNGAVQGGDKPPTHLDFKVDIKEFNSLFAVFSNEISGI